MMFLRREIMTVNNIYDNNHNNNGNNQDNNNDHNKTKKRRRILVSQNLFYMNNRSFPSFMASHSSIRFPRGLARRLHRSF